MLGLGTVLWSGLLAQADRPVNGAPERDWAARIWHHVTLHVAPDEVIEDATLVVEEGRVVAAGPFGTVNWAGPAVVRDLPGFHV